MRVHGSKAELYRPIILAIALTCLTLLSGAIQAQNVAQPKNRVFLWGNNSRYQIGTTPLSWTAGYNTYYGRTTPGFIRAFTNDLTGNISAIACGSNHTLALKTDGTVWCWGDNSYGQLGDGSYAANSDRSRTGSPTDRPHKPCDSHRRRRQS